MSCFTEKELEEIRKFDASLGGDDEDIELTEEEIADSRRRDRVAQFFRERNRRNIEETSPVETERTLQKYIARCKKPLTEEQKARRAETYRRWEEDHREERKQYQRDWYLANRDRIRAKQKLTREANIEESRQKEREQRAKFLAKHPDYYQRRLDQQREYQRARRARLKQQRENQE